MSTSGLSARIAPSTVRPPSPESNTIARGAPAFIARNAFPFARLILSVRAAVYAKKRRPAKRYVFRAATGGERRRRGGA